MLDAAALIAATCSVFVVLIVLRAVFEGESLTAFAFVATLLAIAASMLAASQAGAASCRTTGAAPFTAPDNHCTPGGFVPKSRADVCDGDTDRPTLKVAERRAIVGNYGVPGWTGANGELDHRVPLVLGGTTDRRNIWPEAGPPTNNPKDTLERVILRRVCDRKPHPMRVRTAVLVFFVDWRAAYTYYVLGRGPRP